eukprot:TRINITY_DN405_c6_g1_i1.p1 TRINITY_DN405_c6_g1~~TRINITY_DN405_c6_g1_i1.p1  ORF type:complete len:617 (+),score=218.20 TRINITY_DN405_c6_g1_i1:94-1851(+)
MGDQLGKLFIDVDLLPGLRDADNPDIGHATWDIHGFIQLMFLGACYGYVLFTASGFISEGSELLLFTSFKDIVGSVVLPILGAVPDGAIILFSGSSQAQLAVGVGALAGSTIMLLTIPWSLATIAGRVRCDAAGVPQYSKLPSGRRREPGAWYKQLTDTASAAQEDGNLKVLGYFMLATCTTYFIIQGPAFRYGCKETGCGCLADPTATKLTADETKCLEDKADAESIWALIGTVAAWVFFIVYLWYNASDSEQEGHRQTKAQEAADKYLQQGFNLHGICKQQSLESDVLLAVAKKKFTQLDGNRNNQLEEGELGLLVQQFAENRTVRNDPRASHESRLYTVCMQELAESPEHKLSCEQWVKIMMDYMKAQGPFGQRDALRDSPDPDLDEPYDELTDEQLQGLPEKSGGDEEEDEDEEMPEDVKPPENLWTQALTMMLGGTALVLLFSDPMVDVLAGIGTFIGVPPFYVAFVLAPLASNAAELLSAMSYAAKQTRLSFTVGVSQLLGAACMNNTFCLAIFLTQIYNGKLLWEFSAETICIVFVELIMFFFSQKIVFPTWNALVIAALFPLSIGLVYFLENVVGID